MALLPQPDQMIGPLWQKPLTEGFYGLVTNAGISIGKKAMARAADGLERHVILRSAFLAAVSAGHPSIPPLDE